MADGEDAVTSSWGLAADGLFRLGDHSEVGLGLRWSRTPSHFDDHGNFISVPLLVQWQLAAPGRPNLRLRIGLGGGLAIAWFDDYDEGLGPVYAVGWTAEVRLGLGWHTRSGSELSVDVGLRTDFMEPRNAAPDWYLADSLLVHGQGPFIRLGATFR